MKTGVTHVAVKDLIGVRIKTTEAYFAVSLKELFACRFSGFGGFNVFHIVQELLNHFIRFVSCPMNYVPENRGMHEIWLDQSYLFRKVLILCFHVCLNVRNQVIPHNAVLGVLLIDLTLPKFHLDVNFLAEFHLVLGLHSFLELAYWKVVLQYRLPFQVSDFHHLLNQLLRILDCQILTLQLFYHWWYLKIINRNWFLGLLSFESLGRPPVWTLNVVSKWVSHEFHEEWAAGFEKHMN